MKTHPENVTYVGLFDGPNADNQAAVLGMRKAFPYSEVLIVVSATAAHPDPEAPLSSIDPELSHRVQQMHAARMAGFLGRAGINGCVYAGLPVEETNIVPIVPHSAHVDHRTYDIFGDANGFGETQIAGGFEDFIRRLENSENTIRVVVGGPFSELPQLIRNQNIAPRLGALGAQAGFKPSGRAIYAELSFNGDTDMQATLESLLHYPDEMHFVPSDITRNPSVTFSGHQELIEQGIDPELARIYAQHRIGAELRHQAQQDRRKQQGGEPLGDYPPLSVHDLQAVLALRYALGREDPSLLTFEPIDIDEAIQNMLGASRQYEGRGYAPMLTERQVIELGYNGDGLDGGRTIPPRFAAVDQNSSFYKQRVPELLAPLTTRKT